MPEQTTTTTTTISVLSYFPIYARHYLSKIINATAAFVNNEREKVFASIERFFLIG